MADPPPVVAQAEMCEMLRLTRKRVSTLANAPGFPPPLARRGRAPGRGRCRCDRGGVVRSRSDAASESAVRRCWKLRALITAVAPPWAPVVRRGHFGASRAAAAMPAMVGSALLVLVSFG